MYCNALYIQNECVKLGKDKFKKVRRSPEKREHFLEGKNKAIAKNIQEKWWSNFRTSEKKKKETQREGKNKHETNKLYLVRTRKQWLYSALDLKDSLLHLYWEIAGFPLYLQRTIELWFMPQLDLTCFFLQAKPTLSQVSELPLPPALPAGCNAPSPVETQVSLLHSKAGPDTIRQD